MCIRDSRHLAPAHVGHTGVVPLGAQGHLDGLQHVVGVEPKQDGKKRAANSVKPNILNPNAVSQ